MRWWKTLPAIGLTLAISGADVLVCHLLAQESPSPRRRVAVLGFKNLRNDPDSDWVGAVTADTLTTKLAGLKAMLVVEREQVNKVIQENRFQESDLVNPQTAVKAGRILGAQSAVTGSFAVAGKRVRFNAHVVDVETTEVLSAATLGGAEEEVMDLPLQLADAVIESLSKKVVVLEGQRRVEESAPVKLTDEERKKLAQRPTQNEEAYQAFGRGLDHDKKHRWKEAQPEFESAVRLDPAFGLAWLQLGKMHENQGRWPKALQCYSKADILFQTKRDETSLAWALRWTGNVHCSQGGYAEAMNYFQESLAISRKLGDEPGVARALCCIGAVHFSQGRYSEAMKYHEESLAIARRLGDEPGMAITLGNIGNVHLFQGRYPDAMRCYGESLEIKRRLGNEPGAADTLQDIGAVHFSQGRYDEAMKSYEESLAVSRRLGHEPTVVMTLGNIGNVYYSQRRYAEAIKCYEESLALSRRLGDEPGMARALGNIGNLHCERRCYEEATKCYEESLAIKRRLGDEPGVAKTLFNTAFLYNRIKEYDKGLPLAREAAQLARKMGFPDVADYDKLVADLEKATGR
jgi:tetratricopeptide (TPR) repeat protein